MAVSGQETVWTGDPELYGYDQLRRSHKGWVEEHLGDGAKERQDEWTDSFAVGSKSFIESVKASLGFRARGRDVRRFLHVPNNVIVTKVFDRQRAADALCRLQLT